MKSGIETALDTVDWLPVERPAAAAGELYATHAGVLEIVGIRLRCYRLNDGVAVFDADDVKAWFDGLQEQAETAGAAAQGGRP